MNNVSETTHERYYFSYLTTKIWEEKIYLRPAAQTGTKNYIISEQYFARLKESLFVKNKQGGKKISK